jgi:hypothetical protein
MDPRPPKYREHPELIETPKIRCECRPDCERTIGAMEHYVTVQQQGGAKKRVAVTHLLRFRDEEHHPAHFREQAPPVQLRGGGRATPMPSGDGDE